MVIEWCLIGLLALSIGSFLNVVIVRIPQEKSIVAPRSMCPICKTSLKWYHNIPVFSYMYLKGQCAYCHSDIHIRYLVIELLSVMLFVIIFLKEGFFLQTFLIALVFMLLLALSMIDLAIKMVPDSLNLAALTLAIFRDGSMIHLPDALLLAGGFAFLRYYVSFVIQKEALGEGDIMIAGTMGALLGVQLSLVAIFLAAFLAFPVALYFRFQQQSSVVPFVPFLALGTFCAYLFDKHFFLFLRHMYS
jgi:leader peptidase (prepilin peptidase) / N-methyltransferase